MLTILSNDPGASTKNPGYGYAIIQIRRHKGKLGCRILENGVVPIENTITQLKDSKIYKQQKTAYLQFLAKKIRTYSVQAIVAERYMSRGSFAGSTGSEIKKGTINAS